MDVRGLILGDFTAFLEYWNYELSFLGEKRGVADIFSPLYFMVAFHHSLNVLCFVVRHSGDV